MAGELSGRLEVVEAELSDVRKWMGKLYKAIETSDLTLEALSPRIMSLRHREEQLEAAREEAQTRLEERRVELPTPDVIREYVADFREFLKEGTIPERKALIGKQGVHRRRKVTRRRPGTPESGTSRTPEPVLA